jgi:hypothetical protein
MLGLLLLPLLPFLVLGLLLCSERLERGLGPPPGVSMGRFRRG